MERKRSSVAASLALGTIKAVSFLYDVATLPIYFVVQKPWRNWRSTNETIACQVDPNDPYSPTIRVRRIHDDPFSDVETIHQLFNRIVRLHGDRQCFGTREVLDEEEEVQPDGRIFKKLVMGDYQWITYKEAEARVTRLTSSLLNLGVRPQESVIIFAETRMEWMLVAHACFRLNVPIVTLFSTLGEEGIIHGICESGSPYLITSADLLPKIKKIIDRIPHITHLVYFEGFRKPNLAGFPEKMKIVSYSHLYKLGEQIPEEAPKELPGKDDPAIIMYTSGSSGKPKGVVFSQKHLVYNVSCVYNQRMPFSFRTGDVYIAYLPLAHIFESVVEMVMMWTGVKIGYSSPFTLTDKSTAIKEGDKGDMTALQPSCFIAVPLVLDRIKKSVLEAVEAKGPFTKALFDFAFKYKSRWYRRGFDTPIVDRLIFKKIKDKVGSKLNCVATGGAPLSTDTFEFVRICLGVHLVTAYGQTESSGMGTFTYHYDRSCGHIGPPMKDVLIRLIDWPEGGYFVHDKPYPRGEILIGGKVVADGYFKNEELTRETFFEEDGVRWVSTGDIGERLPNGNYRLIDRKKDLVKLQYGEYVSLGKVEAELKTNPLVDNVCVVGSSYETYLVALVVPNKEQLLKLAHKLGIPEGIPFPELCRNQQVCREVSRTLVEHGKKCRLQRTEIPSKVKLCPEEWVPENGLVTAAMKLRRKFIQQFYQDVINDMYSGGAGGDRHANTKGS